jgi:perosamine synthetase
MVSVIVDSKLGLEKEKLMGLLDKKNIDSRPFFRPLSSIPAYAHMPQADLARQRNAVSYEIAPFGINLPSGMNLDETAVDYVCTALQAVLEDALS